MVSSGMLRHVALVRTDVSEEPNACFIRVTRIGEIGTTLAVTSNRRMLRSVQSDPRKQAVEAHTVCEILWIPQCLDSRLTDGGIASSLTHWPPLYSPET
jgi:hypothetical protein